jgi:DNA-directed RNA polymerase specialized sigma24 family protein
VKERVELDLDTFVATDYPKVVAAVGLITGDREAAAGAVQDAMVGFLKKPPARQIANVAGWITAVATRGARGIPNPTATVPGLETLPLLQRQVCVLHYLLDQSTQTIAEGLGVNEGTVTAQLSRARSALAVHQGKEDDRG